MELTPDIGTSSERPSAAGSSPSNARNSESDRIQANGSKSMKIVDGDPENVMGIESRTTEDTTGTVKEGKKRAAHNDLLGEIELEYELEFEFSSNAHNGMPGVNGMAKAKPAAKKPKLEEPSNTRNPPCWRCREADIPCLGNKTRSSCNACFHHHWKCATNQPPIKGKKPKNNTISANALKHLLWHPVAGSKNTGSKAVGEKGNPVLYPNLSGNTSTATPPPANNASISMSASSKDTVLASKASKPTTKGKEKALVQTSGPSTSYTSSDLPVLILAPPSVSAPTLRLGPPTSLPASFSTESSISASASASSSRLNRNRTRRQDSAGTSKSSREKPVAPTYPDDAIAVNEVLDSILGRRPGHTKTRANPGRSARPTRREFDLDTEEEEEEQGEEKRKPSAAEKGKQKAHESGDVSELSSPPSSIGSTPDPSSALFPTGALEPRSLPTTSTLPTVVTTLNALTNVVKTMRTDLSEVKDTTASLSGSKSALDWGIALNRLDRQEQIIKEQSVFIGAQGKMISAIMKNMMELMEGKFVFDFDVDEGTGGDGSCSTKENGNTPASTSQPVSASVGVTRTGSSDASKTFETALRPVGNDMSTNQASTSHTKGRDTGKPVEQVDRPLVVDTTTNRASVYAPSRPIPVQKASSGSTSTTLTSTAMIQTHPHELPPPRATSFMRPQQKPAASQESRNQVSTPKPAVAGESPVASSSLPLGPSSAGEERPQLSTAHWSQTRVHGDSDEERDELLDDTPMKPGLKQRGWVKTQMMALR